MSMETSGGDIEDTNNDDEDPEIVNFRRALNSNDDDDGVIFVWQVEDGKQVLLNIDPTEYIELKSERTYAFIKGNWKEKTEFWSVFYWIGEKSNDLDATSVATFALSLDSLLHPTINIHRETEVEESQAFDALFKYDESDTTSSRSTEFSSSIGEEETRMILIEGKLVSAPYEVEFSQSYLKEDEVCFVAFNSETVYVYCGAGATEDAQILLTKKLAEVLSRKMGPQSKVVTLIRSVMNNSDQRIPNDEKLLLEEFSQEMERILKKIDEQKPVRPSVVTRMGSMLRRMMPFGHSEEEEDVDDDDDDNDDNGIEDNGDNDDDDDDEDDQEDDDEELDDEDTIDLQIRHVYRSEHNRIQEKNFGSTPLLLFPFRSEDCYILDSCLGRVGIVVWMGTKSEMEKREECIKRAELLLRKRKNCHKRPIFLIDENNVDLPTEPKIYVYLKSLILLMNNLDLSWEDMLKPPTSTSHGDFPSSITELVIPYVSQRPSRHVSPFFII